MATTLIAKPPYRKLKGYAFDPALSLNMETAPINTIVYKVPWEDDLEPGPVGEYVEVVDYDPTTKTHYSPVDLNDPYLLAQDGHEPSEGNPQFHQQMAYAVVMTTIKNFERALGRPVLWASRQPGAIDFEDYVPRLRIYPHALREANAYYSPQKKALLFGYFSSTPANESVQMPDSLVFSCLSHDILAHETTHAILDGMHRNYNEPTNPDVLAFHEAFADIVALFQHFTFPDVLKNQIRQTQGDLAAQNLLGQLAQQFGSAIGRYGSLRDAIGGIDEATQEWKPKTPDPNDYRTVMEPHARGSILVAAVFEAFIHIYKNRVADLIRIASKGTGILEKGELPTDLVNRLAEEAAKAADHVLQMCIRALDYCPPVDITFGDYLRALITADVDLVADDQRNYRLAFIDAFRRRGIYPKGIKTLSVESLRYAKPTVSDGVSGLFAILTEFLRDYHRAILYARSQNRQGRQQMVRKSERQTLYEIARRFIGGDASTHTQGLHNRLMKKFSDSMSPHVWEFEKLTGLILNSDYRNFGIRDSKANPGQPSFRVENLRLVSRVGPQGNQINQIVFSMVQRTGVLLQEGVFNGNAPVEEKHFNADTRPMPMNGFVFRGGCTLIFDLDTLTLNYAITSPLLDTEVLTDQQSSRKVDKQRIERQYRYQFDEQIMCLTDHARTFGVSFLNGANEPFALLHQH